MFLERINDPKDLKDFSQSDLKDLALEVRGVIIDTVAKNGGHLASNLGAVELTIALHRVFSSPRDAIIFDVSHQCYTHKLLTGRYKDFSTLRKRGGLSGFTKQQESPHDYFDNGHASNAISQALGLLAGWGATNKEDKKKSERYVVAVVGDGALTGGLAFEGLSNAAETPYAKNLIIVLNDNQMSIDQNTGSISSYLSRLTMTTHYQHIRRFIDRAVEVLPFIGSPLSKFVYRFKRALKGLLLFNNLFSDLNLEYVGPLDGHDEKCMERILRRVKKMHKPVVVHVITKKGKGYNPAEAAPERFHGVGPFCISDGKQEKFDIMSWTEAFSEALVEIATTNSRVICVTAAMSKGTGLAAFSRKFPERFFDVGIAEGHAVTFAASLSKGGAVPIVAIYSTFLQRAVDEVIHDAALQGLPLIIMADRAGAVPQDGETHQGVFDIALFRAVPGITIFSPATAGDLRVVLSWAVSEARGPVLIRYPKASCPNERPQFYEKITTGRGILLKARDICTALTAPKEDKKHKKILFVITGGLLSEAVVALRALLLRGVESDIYTLRFIKPIDEKYFLSVVRGYHGVVFAEDGVKSGGVSERLALLCAENGVNNFIIKAFGDKFFPQGTREEILTDAGLSPLSLVGAALGLIGGNH